MAPRCMSDRVKLFLTLRVLLMFVISTSSKKQCTFKKTEGDVHVIRNIGIKLCHLKCAEHGQCASIQYNTETLTCSLLKDESKIEKKKGRVILASSHLHVPTASCTSGMCSFGQRCLKTRSGKEVCVHASTDPKLNTVPPAPVTTQDSDPQVTPSPADRRLLYASRDGDLQRVKRILAKGHVDINTRGDYSRTLVMVAALYGHKGVVEFLVGKGADVSLVGRFGNNVLHLACNVGDLDTVKLILSLDVLDINSRGSYNRTPVMMAARRGHRDVVEFLLGRGANVLLVDDDGNNALHLACYGGHLGTVKLIVCPGVVDINARNNNGKKAADYARLEGHQQLMDVLVSHGAH